MKPEPNATGMHAHRDPADPEGGLTGVSIEVSEEEFEMARAMAEQQGMSLDEWVAGVVQRELEGEVGA